MPAKGHAAAPPGADGARSASAMAARAARLGGVAAAIVALVAAGAPACPVAFFLRVPCPGCGLTRATLRLAQGDLAGALAFHPLVPVALPLVVAFGTTNAVAYVVTGRWGYVDRLQGRFITWCAVLLMLLFGGVWAARFFGAFGGPVPV